MEKPANVLNETEIQLQINVTLEFNLLRGFVFPLEFPLLFCYLFASL